MVEFTVREMDFCFTKISRIFTQTERRAMNAPHNPSLCVYVGNTSAVDDQALLNYCAQFNSNVPCLLDEPSEGKWLFCDFRIMEFATEEQLRTFLDVPAHKINGITLDVRFYPSMFDKAEMLNTDRKLFIGPLVNSTDINAIVQFYKFIDPRLEYAVSRKNQQTYVLMEFSNRQYARTILEQRTIPKTVEDQVFNIHPAVSPTECIDRTLPLTDGPKQICTNPIDKLPTQTTRKSM